MKRLFLVVLVSLVCSALAFGAEEAKVSTARTFTVGSFVDVGDGFTPETGVTISAMDEKVMCLPNGGACQPLDDTVNSWTAVTSGDGHYNITIAGGSLTNYGHHTLIFNDDNVFLPLTFDIDVVSANYWDTKYGTDVMQADVTQVGGDAITDNGDGRLEVNVEEIHDTAVASTVAGVIDANVTYWEDSAVTDSDGVPDVNVSQVAGGAQSATDLKDFADAGYDPDNDRVVKVYQLTELDEDNTTMDLNATAVGAAASVAGNVDGNVTGTIGGLAAQAKTDVNGQVVDVINTDPSGEPAGVPAATASLRQKIDNLHFALRNKITTSGSSQTYWDDAGTSIIWKSTLSDDGATFTKGEIGSP